MRFETTTVAGAGRGNGLGFPTINFNIQPEVGLSLQEGIYAARVTIAKETYPAALYYGSIPTFGQKERSLEAYIINAPLFYAGPGESAQIEPVKFIRGVQEFSSPDLLMLQMEKDVAEIKKVLHLES